MCGICGVNWGDENLVKRMNKVISHRGPDDSGSKVADSLSLGHVRLSIVDISDAGHQPMFYSKSLGASSEKFNSNNISSSDVSIVFNGEVYNYLELRGELEGIGYVFSTGTDTEVILASYMEWGQDCVTRFNGMWSFVIWDKSEEILFCSRDRLGQKPFYYYLRDGKFVFCSELKGILESVNLNKFENISHEAVQLYFSLGFIPSPYCIFNDVYKLEASHNLVFDLKSKKISKYYKYYEIPDFKPVYDKDKLIKEGRELFRDATKLRMRSDVSVGAFLSGGLDSSSVVGEMKSLTDISKLHTFSIGFEGKNYDETPYVNIIKDHFGTIHHHRYFKKKDFDNLVDKYSEVYDEPFGDYSGFPTLHVSSLAREWVTVSLSGDGGDEIFAGYNMHLVGARMDFINKCPRVFRRLGSKIPVSKNLDSYFSLYSLKKAFELSMINPKEFYINMVESDKYNPNVFREWGSETFSKSFHKGGGKLSESFRIHDLIYRSLADNFLVKVDRASMNYGLEVRSPFLDYRFIEFAQKIPTKWKIDIKDTKKLLKEISKDVLPKSVLSRSKRGFTPPVEDWVLEKKYEDYMYERLELLKDFDEDLYKYYSEKVFKENFKVYSYDKIRLFLFLRWYDKWIK